MNTISRYVVLFVCVVVSMHFLLSYTHNGYNNTVGSRLKIPHCTLPNEGPTHAYQHPIMSPDTKANATFVILARNSDLKDIMKSVNEIEYRFNRKYRYPYVFLNDEEFSEEFKSRLSNIVSSKIEFGLVPRDHWVQPDWIDEEKAKVSRKKLEALDVLYADSVSYRNMCRFNSGFFFRHELLQKYKFYWRIEPDVKFHCDITYDPFKFMADHKKAYGFTVTLYEYLETIPTLWGHVLDFAAQNPHHIPVDNAMDYMSDDGGKTYNKCHFWSNFEIGDMDFWRSEAYMSFFEHLDKQGGFYYERWGDAPVHTIGAALLLHKDQIHFFDDIGYEHNPFAHCPQGDAWVKGRCSCDQGKSFDYDGYSCKPQWDRLWQ